jgi:hypothetical protein
MRLMAVGNPDNSCVADCFVEAQATLANAITPVKRKVPLGSFLLEHVTSLVIRHAFSQTVPIKNFQ